MGVSVAFSPESHGVQPRELYEDFDYGAIDERLGLEDADHKSEAGLFCSALKNIIDWIDEAKQDSSKALRVQVVKYFFTQKNQVELAAEIGATKAGVSKLARQFSEHFQIWRHNQRKEETCKKFSEQTKRRHEIRKAMELNPSLLQQLK